MKVGLKMREIKPLLCVVYLFFTLGCGRDIDNSKPELSGQQRQEQREFQEAPPSILKQKFRCDGVDCPEFLTRIIIDTNELSTNCVGTLISEDTVISSASCFPSSLRVGNLRCDPMVYFQFADSRSSKGDVIACDKIISSDIELLAEPALWGGDFILLKLAKKVDRDFARLSSTGIKKEILDFWEMKKESKDVFLASKKSWSALLGTYLNPNQSKFSPMFVTTGCELSKDSWGAPLMRGNKVYGTFSKEMDIKFYEYLASSNIVKGEIGRYFHFSNISCGNFLSDFGEGVPPRECLNLTSEAELDIARSRVLSAQKPSGEIENQILNAIDSESEFFKWNIEFVYNENLNKFQTQIKSARCLLDGKSWAGAPRYRSRWLGNLYSKSRFDYEITRYLIETKLNSQLNPVSSFETSGSSLYEIEFSPYDAFVKGETFVNFSFISNSDDSISGSEGEQSESAEPVPSC